MSSPSREFFTVDLRGLRAGLRARAASNGLTESAVLCSVLSAAFGTERSDSSPSSADVACGPMIATRTKLSIRLARPAAYRLDHNARGAGAPPVVASCDRAAMFNALNASSAELALLSRDINHLTRLLRQGNVEAARSYAARHEALDADIRRHLALAATVLAEFSSLRLFDGQTNHRQAHGSQR
jgi:hypothetical protein